MYDPVSITVFAMVQALLTGAAKAIGEAAGRDAYQALKSALLTHYPAARPSLDNLERNPGSQNVQDQLIGILRSMGAGNDRNLQGLAEKLQNAIKFLSPGDPVDEQKRASGFRTIQQTLADHLNNLIRIRAQYRVDDSGLLSSNISRATDVPEQLRAEVRALHGRIRRNIESIARMIEDGNYRDTEDFIAGLPSLNMRERATSLVKADKDLHVSYQTLRLSVDYFSKFNTMLLDEIDQEGPANRQLHFMFGNAIIVYELADYIIDFMENFTPGGIRDLEDLHKAALRRIEATREDQKHLIETANSGQIDAKLRESRLKAAREREEALTTLQEEWKTYIKEASQFYTRVENVREMVPNLEFIREDARIQIQMLEMVSMLQLLRESLNSVQGTVDALAGFRLAQLNSTRVRQLLGS